jgi:hypothetical protein
VIILPSPLKVKPYIKSTKKDSEDKDQGSRQFNINQFFYIVNNERARIGEVRMMLCPQPDLEVCKRTGPIEYLNDESKDQARDMKDLYSPIFYSPKGTKKEK